jgi:hypothetical protein
VEKSLQGDRSQELVVVGWMRPCSRRWTRGGPRARRREGSASKPWVVCFGSSRRLTRGTRSDSQSPTGSRRGPWAAATRSRHERRGVPTRRDLEDKIVARAWGDAGSVRGSRQTHARRSPRRRESPSRNRSRPRFWGGRPSAPTSSSRRTGWRSPTSSSTWPAAANTTVSREATQARAAAEQGGRDARSRANAEASYGSPGSISDRQRGSRPSPWAWAG